MCDHEVTYPFDAAGCAGRRCVDCGWTTEQHPVFRSKPPRELWTSLAYFATVVLVFALLVMAS